MSDKIKVNIDQDLQEIVPSFLENRQKDLIELAKAIAGKDFKSIEVIGHKLAGNAGGYGFDLLGTYGAEMEKAAQSGELQTIISIVDKIEDYLKRVEITYV